MQKKFYSFSLCVLLFSCKDPQVEKLEAQMEESKCKQELMDRIITYGENTDRLALELGMKKEIETFQAAMSDSTITCDSLEILYNEYQDKVDKKAEESKKYND